MVAPIVCVNGSIAGTQKVQGKAAAALQASCCRTAATRCPPAAAFTCPCSLRRLHACRWTAWRSPSRACGATLPACAPGAPTPPCWTESRWVLPGAACCWWVLLAAMFCCCASVDAAVQVGSSDIPVMLVRWPPRRVLLASNVPLPLPAAAAAGQDSRSRAHPPQH